MSQSGETRVVSVDYLFLDLETCDRCVGTDRVLKDAIAKAAPIIEDRGCRIVLKETQIENAAMAREYRFVSSPTIRVNGIDICQEVTEDDCGCCSDISGTDTLCRTFIYEGKTYHVPPVEMLVGAIVDNAFREPVPDTSEYVLPQNLDSFFKGKESMIPMVRLGCC